jgi:hypothetical protein
MVVMKDGGPAFPKLIRLKSNAAMTPIYSAESTNCMTLRDYFASHEDSLPPDSWIQSTFGSHNPNIDSLQGVDYSHALSKWRYQMADAMLEERKK